jgi:hypothetical protein
LRSKPTLIVVADVTPSAVGLSERSSVAAIVGSVDLEGMRYTPEVSVQGFGVEFIGDVNELMV